MPSQILRRLICVFKRKNQDRRVYFSSALLTISLFGVTFSFPGQTQAPKIAAPTFAQHSNNIKVNIKTGKVIVTAAPVKKITPTPTASPIPTKAIVKITPAPTRTVIDPTPIPTTVVSQPTQAPTVSQPTSPSSYANDMFNALNEYRKSHGVGTLSWDSRLASFAQGRAEFFMSNGGLDNHAGFKPYMDSQLGVNYMAMGENSSWNYKISPSELITRVYGESSGHNANQLNPKYTVVGIGYSGTASDVIFGLPK